MMENDKNQVFYWLFVLFLLLALYACHVITEVKAWCVEHPTLCTNPLPGCPIDTRRTADSFLSEIVSEKKKAWKWKTIGKETIGKKRERMVLSSHLTLIYSFISFFFFTVWLVTSSSTRSRFLHRRSFRCCWFRCCIGFRKQFPRNVV